MVDLVIVVLPLLIGLVVFIISKVKDIKNWRVNSYIVFKEWQFVALLFVQIHLGIAISIAYRYDDQKMVGLVLGGIVELMTLFYLFLYIKYHNNFG